MMKLAAAPLAGMIALCACAPVDQPDTVPAEVKPAVQVTGAAKSCISASLVRNTKVRGDGVIDFELDDGKIYRNALSQGCPALRRGDAIAYDVRGGNLCSGEIVFELNNIGGQLSRGAACGLGEFVPVEYADTVSDAPAMMDN
ncbi:hypothetical protein AAG614_12360 [Citromicrobium bathyomarinum]